MKKRNKKKTKVDEGLLEESLQVSKKLQEAGLSTRKEYSMRSPFEKRLFRVSTAELVHSAA